MVAPLQVGDAVADFLDDAGHLVAKHHRQRPRTVAVDHRQVRMTQPGGAHLDQHLARPGSREVEFLDGQWARIRERAGSTRLAQHGGSGLDHGYRGVAQALAGGSTAIMRTPTIRRVVGAGQA